MATEALSMIAVDHHLRDVGGDLDGVGGDHGDLVGELVLAGAGFPRSCKRGRGVP